jgi:hypothetical protein
MHRYLKLQQKFKYKFYFYLLKGKISMDIFKI